MLAHNATLAVGAYLDEGKGNPFAFDTQQAPVLVQVPQLYRVVKAAWDKRDKTIFHKPRMKGRSPNQFAQAPELSIAVSGVTNADHLKQQWIKAIEDNLKTVGEWCLDRERHGGHILGYTAALLLFCTIDAMGHGLLPPERVTSSGLR
jgi:hypothetical protein